MRIIGSLIAAVPFGFALIRAATTGTDYRYLWLAMASTLAAGLMVGLARRANRGSSGRLVRVALAVFAAAGASGVTAFALGAGSAPAVLVVSFGFAVCSGVGLALAAQPRAG